MNKECLLPMCPDCITEHNEYHQRNLTVGDYISIEKAGNETSILIRDLKNKVVSNIYDINLLSKEGIND